MINDFSTIQHNLAAVRERIAAVGGTDVDILAVTKGFGPEAIVAAVSAGLGAIGENYVQELLGKLEQLAEGAVAGADLVDLDQLEVHVIGQLQSNKVRQLAGKVALYQTVDRAKIAREIAKRDPGAAVLIQVDTVGAEGKGGWPIGQLDQLVELVVDLGLDLRGLMTVGPTQGPPQAAAAGFKKVRAAVDRLGLSVCSMGMSGDLEVAVAQGATQIRVGSAIFGNRPIRGLG